MEKFILKLYVMDQTPVSKRAINNLEKICKAKLSGLYDITVIDILQDPEMAEQDKIIAIPTLIKAEPPPVRRIVGDLTDVETVLLGLDIQPDDTLEEGRTIQ